MKFSVTGRATEKLREQLLQKCFETSIGFRLAAHSGEAGKSDFNIKLDRQYENDTVIDLRGIKLFLDPVSVNTIADYELDWLDGPDTGFFLKSACEEGDGGDRKAQ
ncbi:MAG: hypothetical protein HYX91_03385 [Chloroflexi bacterium]|nr:hypothetical protein [Chloroflexota bacterium]